MWGADDSWDFFTEPDPSNGCKSPSSPQIHIESRVSANE
jgi:hypothetical protein